MDTLVYPIAASDDEKLNLISKSLEDGNRKIKSASKYNNLAFSDFFNQATPKCLKSIFAISNGENRFCSSNYLNWNRFFKEITQDDILQDATQVVGQNSLDNTNPVTFLSNIIETDCEQGAGCKKGNKDIGSDVNQNIYKYK